MIGWVAPGILGGLGTLANGSELWQVVIAIEVDGGGKK